MFVTYPDVRYLSGCACIKVFRRSSRCEVVVGGALCTVLDLLAWFPNNVARNFHVNLSSIEIALLELQRLWRMLKIQGRDYVRDLWGVSGGLMADG